jgi:hypothetical protein
VLSKNELIVVECGHTQNPEKIFVYFRQGKVQEFIQIPYPNQDDDTVDTVFGYSFVARSNLNNFLVFLDKEKRTGVKKIFKKDSA